MIDAIDHIAVAVRSIEEARGFYEQLGLVIEEIEVVPHEGVRVAMIRCGDCRIELLEPIGEDSPVARFLERRGPGLHHLCLRSTDVQADDATLRSMGRRLLRPEPSPGAGGAQVQFVHPQSAAGVLVELSQPSDIYGSRDHDEGHGT